MHRRLSSHGVQEAHRWSRGLNEEGFRVVAVASQDDPADRTTYSVADERDLDAAGFMAFLDPPKATARQAIAALHAHGVE